MALGQMRGAALAAARAVLSCERARECPRVLAVPAGPSWHGPELACPSRPAAERTQGRRLPAPSRASAAAVVTVSRFAVEPMLREIPARYAPERRKEGLLMRAQWT
jgi:hypothetical protein